MRNAGLFDENILPVYYEDHEYSLRLALLGVEIEVSNFSYVHRLEKNVATTRFSGQMLLSGKTIAMQRRQQIRANSPCYVAGKWGLHLDVPNTGYALGWYRLPRKPFHATPWNDSSLPISYWEIIPGRRKFVLGEQAPAHLKHEDQAQTWRSSSRKQPPAKLLVLGLFDSGLGSARALRAELQGVGYFTGGPGFLRATRDFGYGSQLHSHMDVIVRSVFSSAPGYGIFNDISAEARQERFVNLVWYTAALSGHQRRVPRGLG